MIKIVCGCRCDEGACAYVRVLPCACVCPLAARRARPRPQEDADQAASLAPDWAKGHARRGAALLGCGRPADAAAAYRRALELEPASAAYRDSLRDAQRRAGAGGGGAGGGWGEDDDEGSSGDGE
jgi:hypothetical protein